MDIKDMKENQHLHTFVFGKEATSIPSASIQESTWTVCGITAEGIPVSKRATNTWKKVFHIPHQATQLW